MRRLSFLFSIPALLGLLFIISCGKDDSPSVSPAEAQFNKLTGTWNVVDVKFNNNDDRTADFSGFTLTLGGTLASPTYNTSNSTSPGPWAPSGNWNFGGTAESPNINQMVLSNGPTISVSLTDADETLVLNFTYNEDTHGTNRLEAVDGQWRFELTK